MKKGKIYKLWSTSAAVLLICLLALTAACGGQQANQGPSNTPSQNAPDKEYILIGRVNPTTGAMAGFGEGTPLIEQKAIDAVNAEGGIYIKEYDKKLPLKLLVADSESNSTKTSEAANKLATQDKVDILIGSHTAETVNPISAAAERNQVPCVTVDAPVNAWLEGGPYHWSYHAFWRTESYARNHIAALGIKPSNKKVGIVFSNALEGIDMSKAMNVLLPESGYTVVDPGRFPVNTKDFTSMISKFKEEDCELIVGNMIAPDFAVMLRQFHQQGYVPKTLVMGQAILFPSTIEALGNDLGEGLITEVWWGPDHPFKSSITGQTSAELCQMYTDETGKQPTTPLGYKHANIEIVVDVLKRAQTLDKEALRQAIAETDMDTIVGHIKFNDEHYSETQLVMGQWVKGEKWPWEQIIIYNQDAPEIPLSDKPMIYPLPGCTFK